MAKNITNLKKINKDLLAPYYCQIVQKLRESITGIAEEDKEGQEEILLSSETELCRILFPSTECFWSAVLLKRS